MIRELFVCGLYIILNNNIKMYLQFGLWVFIWHQISKETTVFIISFKGKSSLVALFNFDTMEWNKPGSFG